MIETSDYWIQDNKFIFKPEFNSSVQVYIDLISELDELIFSNYDDVNICVGTNNKYDENYKKNYKQSKFNCQVELPKKLLGLSFNWEFNRQVELPKKLLGLSFGWCFN